MLQDEIRKVRIQNEAIKSQGKLQSLFGRIWPNLYFHCKLASVLITAYMLFHKQIKKVFLLCLDMQKQLTG